MLEQKYCDFLTITGKPLTVLVYPSNYHVGSDIYQFLQGYPDIELIGVSLSEQESGFDNGQWRYNHYTRLPSGLDDEEKITWFQAFIEMHRVDVVFPTRDHATMLFACNAERFSAKIISPSAHAAKVCYSKRRTYEELRGKIPLPVTCDSPGEIENFPIWAKPSIGVSGAHNFLAENLEDLQRLLDTPDARGRDYLFCEYLPGREYTIDCISNIDSELIFCGPRLRRHTLGGTSIDTQSVSVDELPDIKGMAEVISTTLGMTGSWFFQVKENKNKEPTLLEVAARIAGSMNLHLSRGVNFARASLEIAMGYEYAVVENMLNVRMFRSLSTKHCIEHRVDRIYIENLRSLIFESANINWRLLEFCYHCLAKKIKIILITELCLTDITDVLESHRVGRIFDDVISLDLFVKSDENNHFVFISSDVSSRTYVKQKWKAPVYSAEEACVLDVKFVRNIEWS